MKIITGGPASGKTTMLIRESAETFAYIVTRSQRTATDIFNYAGEMGLQIPLPLTYMEFLNADYYAPGVKGILIDDVDTLMQHISRVGVYTITLTTEGVLKETP